MVMGRITNNCYEMDFSSGVLCYEVAGIVLGFTYLTSAVTHVVHTILYPFSLIPDLPSYSENIWKFFYCAYRSEP